jgi:hypothetical protein
MHINIPVKILFSYSSAFLPSVAFLQAGKIIPPITGAEEGSLLKHKTCLFYTYFL